MSNLPVKCSGDPTDLSSQPPGLSLCRDNLDGELGHITVNLSTPYLVVSGYTHLDLGLTNIAVPIKLHDVKVELIPTYILQNLSSTFRQCPGHSDYRAFVSSEGQ